MQSAWFENDGNMKLDRMNKLIEYIKFLYLLLLEARVESAKLEFKPDDKLVKLAANINQK